MTPVGLNQHLYDLHKQIDALAKQADLVSGQAEELLAERADITETLTAFYRAPLSLSSVQPILDLAVRLNPALKTERHQVAVLPDGLTSLMSRVTTSIAGQSCE